MEGRRLTGAFTAIVTPFNKDKSIDIATLRNLVDRQIEAGISGIVPCGTTGEAAAMTLEEHREVVSTVVEQTAGRATVIGGAGANSTAKAIELSKICQEAGVDALLQIAPGYIKPTQRGIIEHFNAILDAVDLPIVIYNVPGRTAVTITPETILKLAQDPRIIAVKQALTDLDQVTEIVAGRPAHFSVLSGEDSCALPMMALGGDGVVSVVGNQLPQQLVDLCRAALAGDRDQAIAHHQKLAPIMGANFVESNPIPVKFAMSEMGLLENVLRSPMTPLAAEFQSIVKTALQSSTTDVPARSAEAVTA